MPRSDYHERRNARINRYYDRAERANREANRRFNSENVKAVAALAGEPIKIGHHSEKRHRRLIEKADNDMRKGCEATDKAKHYGLKAIAAEANRAISSDDPEAVTKLRAKLETAEAKQRAMKAANRVVRKKGLADAEKAKRLAEILGWAPTTAAKLLKPDCCGRLGFPDYALANNNANIRRMKARLATLKAAFARADEPDAATDYDGFRVVENHEINRLQIIFPGKPSEAARGLLKMHGFRWSRQEAAWQRILTANACNRVKLVAEKLPELL